MNTSTLTKPQNEETVYQPTPSNTRTVSPRVDIMESRDRYILRADLPGVEKDGLEIQLENNELTIVGNRKNPLSDSQFVYRETADIQYRRTFLLDPSIDTAKIKARLENGSLILELPKAESVKPRKIAVTG